MDFRAMAANRGESLSRVERFRPSANVRSVPDGEAARDLIEALRRAGVTTAEVVNGPGGRLFVRWTLKGCDPSFAGTVIIQNVTKPKLALLHQTLPKIPLAGNELRKAGVILAELVSGRQYHPYSAQNPVF